MPRLVDETKMHRIKDAAIELIVENGYGGASISSIAKKAGVAEGYLYRYYSGKQDLITDLLYSRVNVLIQELELLLVTCSDVKTLLFQMYQRIFEIADNQPEHIKFIHVLMHDYNFQISDEQRKQIKMICSKVIAKGISNNEINPDITEEEIYLMAVVYPIEMINMRMKNFFGNKKWLNTDIIRLTDFCFNAIK